MRVAIACGGTGGHIYPALAVAQALRDREPSTDVLFIGSGGIESRIIPEAGWPFRRIAARQLSRRVSWKIPWAVGAAAAGTVQAGRHLRTFRPAAVLSTGGYAAAPVGAAATVLRIPLVLQEQNLYPGLTNRLLQRSARAVSVPHESAARFFGSKAAVTGVPIDRTRVLNGIRERGLQRFGLHPARMTILVLGGSQGARTINEAMVEAAPLLQNPHGTQVLHQAGPVHETSVRNRVSEGALRYVVVGYIENVADAYACADLVVCRAGASTLAEVTACGLPCVVVPYPFAAEGHQEANARVHERAGAAVVVLDRELSGERLAALLNRLRDDPAAVRAMADASGRLGRPDAADRVAALVASAAGGATGEGPV